MRQDWRDRAACAGGAGDVTSLFFPSGQTANGATYDYAKRICGVCPVRAECLAFAMDTEYKHYRYGIYGGLTAKERHQLHVATR